MDLAIILLLLGGVILTAGDIFMKEWVSSNRSIFYILGIGVYVIGLNFLAHSFKSKNIAVASVMFVIFNIITLSIFSWFYFKESLSPVQITGIILGIVTIVLLENQ